jgi:hypothetical protein
MYDRTGYQLDEETGTVRPKEFFSKDGWEKKQLHSKFFGSRGRTVASFATTAAMGGILGGLLDSPYS